MMMDVSRSFFKQRMRSQSETFFLMNIRLAGGLVYRYP